MLTQKDGFSLDTIVYHPLLTDTYFLVFRNWIKAGIFSHLLVSIIHKGVRFYYTNSSKPHTQIGGKGCQVGSVGE